MNAWIAVFVYLCLFVFSIQSAPADEKTTGQQSAKVEKSASCQYVTVPVYFATDRNQEPKTYGSKRRYAVECEHHLYYGTAHVVVKNRDRLDDDVLRSCSENLGWAVSKRGPAKYATEDRISSGDPEEQRKQFFDTIAAATKRTPDHQLCVFVHGAADCFEDSLQDAASLSYAMHAPLILYSWPAAAKFTGYLADNSNSEWSQAHFNMFCSDLDALKKETPFKLTLIAHSMGNRLVIRCLPAGRNSTLVDDFELISPDMDLETTKHYVMNYHQKNTHVRLYVSNKDKMLALSQMVFGGYYRLGEDVYNYKGNPSADKTSAGKDEEKDSVKILGMEADPHRFERIDFTAIDSGLRGHSIPFSLVAHMVKNDTPGPGLTLEQSGFVHLNRFTRLAGHGVEKQNAKSVEPLYFKRVVKIRHQ